MRWDLAIRNTVGRLKYPFEAISELENEDKQIVREVLEELIVKYQAKCWSRISNMTSSNSG